MHIFIKCYEYTDFITIPINIQDLYITIDELRKVIELETGIPKKLQFITYNSIPLNNDNNNLKDYKIHHDSTLHVRTKV